MSRPLIGDRPLTPTERWRRWYAKHRQGKLSALRVENAELRAEVAALRRERDKLAKRT